MVDKKIGLTPLTWYRTGATSHSAGAILNVLEKIAELRTTGLTERNLSALNPNRLKLLARIGGKATNQALERLAPERRYPILLAFLHQTLTDTIDEAVDLYDRCLEDAYARAGRELDEFRKSVAKTTNEKVSLLQTIGRIVIDPAVSDSEIRALIYQQIAPDVLRTAVDECEQLIRPLDDSYFDLLGTRYSHLRQFAPKFLATFTWRANREDDKLLAAIEGLRKLNAAGLRKLPESFMYDLKVSTSDFFQNSQFFKSLHSPAVNCPAEGSGSMSSSSERDIFTDGFAWSTAFAFANSFIKSAASGMLIKSSANTFMALLSFKTSRVSIVFSSSVIEKLALAGAILLTPIAML